MWKLVSFFFFLAVNCLVYCVEFGNFFFSVFLLSSVKVVYIFFSPWISCCSASCEV